VHINRTTYTRKAVCGKTTCVIQCNGNTKAVSGNWPFSVNIRMRKPDSVWRYPKALPGRVRQPTLPPHDRFSASGPIACYGWVTAISVLVFTFLRNWRQVVFHHQCKQTYQNRIFSNYYLPQLVKFSLEFACFLCSCLVLQDFTRKVLRSDSGLRVRILTSIRFSCKNIWWLARLLHFCGE